MDNFVVFPFGKRTIHGFAINKVAMTKMIWWERTTLSYSRLGSKAFIGWPSIRIDNAWEAKPSLVGHQMTMKPLTLKILQPCTMKVHSMWSNALDRSRLSMNLLHFLEGTSWKEWTISWADVVTDISTVNKSIRGVVYISIWLGTWHLMQSDINNMHKLIGLKSWGEVEDGLFGDESNDSFNNKTRELDHLCCRFGDD